MSNKSLIDMEAFWDITYGLYIVSAREGDKLNGLIVNTVVQVTLTPIQIAISIHKDNLTHELIEKNKAFGISVLEQNTPMAFIGTWGFSSGREIDKFENTQYQIGQLKVPLVISHAVSIFETKLVSTVDVGTHTVFIGEVIASKVLNQNIPLTYEYYQTVYKGKTPKNSPLYKGDVIERAGKNEDVANKYVCTVCGYVYYPQKGDPQQGINPGTPFEKLPEKWICPICKVKKDKFKKQ